MPSTSANISELGKWAGFQPDTQVTVGVQKFAEWYLGYHKNNG
jgi:UDP-glucuronate 4-epimerase